MDDKFLYQNRPPVRPGFSESLYARISNVSTRKKSLNIIFKFALRLVLTGLLGSVILFSFAEPARANILVWIKQIAGFGIQEEDELSGLDDAIFIPVDFKGPLADALKELPFKFSMPAYLPDKYLFYDEVDISKKDQSIFMRWVNPNGGEIVMQVQVDGGQGIVTGEGASEEIIINGHSAALVRGGYDANSKWDSTKQDIHLYWHKGNLIYILFSASTSEEELIRIVESIT